MSRLATLPIGWKHADPSLGYRCIKAGGEGGGGGATRQCRRWTAVSTNYGRAALSGHRHIFLQKSEQKLINTADKFCPNQQPHTCMQPNDKQCMPITVRVSHTATVTQVSSIRGMVRARVCLLLPNKLFWNAWNVVTYD